MGQVFDWIGSNIGSIAGATIGSIIAPGIGTAIGAGIGGGTQTGIETGDPLKGLASGVLTGGGSYLGSEFLGPIITENVTSPIASSLGSSAGNALGGAAGSEIGHLAGTVAGNALGTAAGGLAGSTLATNAAESMGLDLRPEAKTPAAWSPIKATGYSLPQALSSYSTMNPAQQSSAIATQGLYGGGMGSEENKYFTNLINNRLLESQGSDISSQITPAEMSYLEKLGLGGYSQENDLLKAMESYAT